MQKKVHSLPFALKLQVDFSDSYDIHNRQTAPVLKIKIPDNTEVAEMPGQNTNPETRNAE